METLDPYQRPPDGIRTVYKRYQKMHPNDLDRDVQIVDPGEELQEPHKSRLGIIEEICPMHLFGLFETFASVPMNHRIPEPAVGVYEHDEMPGLHIIPNLLPPEIQLLLLDRLLHRDFSCPAHLTNIHTHYEVSYPLSNASFFSLQPENGQIVATPLDPSIHKPMSIAQLLNRKLRWTTLGGQYDWTAKRYPDLKPPPFPPDVKALLEGIFTDTKAEAAIVNLYSPGDTLSVHRDVAESCSTGLISVSLGCDAIFVVGTEAADGTEKMLALRLRSGSAVYMSGSSRFAWHGVPQIVTGTCPEYLKSWPAKASYEDGEIGYEQWRGWMAGKRVNLNVRQMWDSPA